MQKRLSGLLFCVHTSVGGHAPLLGHALNGTDDLNGGKSTLTLHMLFVCNMFHTGCNISYIRLNDNVMRNSQSNASFNHAFFNQPIES